MKTFCFEKDMTFQLGSQQNTIVRIVPDPEHKDDPMRHTICYENHCGLYDMKPMFELLALYEAGKLTLGNGNVYIEPTLKSDQTLPHRHITTLTQEVLADARRKQGYIQAILSEGDWCSAVDHLGPIVRRHAESVGDKRAPSRASITRWYRRLRANNFDWQCLINRDDRKGNKTNRHSQEEMDMYSRVLRREYLTDQRRSLTKVFHTLHHDIALHNKRFPSNPLRMISYAGLNRLKMAIPAYERELARRGRHMANIEYRKGQVAPAHSHILEVAEIDHTPIDLVVVCDETGLTLGSPYLTMIIDAYSRMPLGFHVSFDAPCVQSVVAAMAHAIMPKTYLKESYGCVKNTWPAYGKMQTLVSDNGPEFHAQELEDICLKLGTILQYCPSRVPFYKGKIERFLKTFNSDLIHDIPGTRFNNYQEAGDYQSEKKAVLTIKTLVMVIHKWLVDVYMVSHHETINMTPLEKWQSSVIDNPPMLPADIDCAKQTILRISTRKLRIPGIELFKIVYNSDELHELRKEIGNDKSVNVRYCHSDLSHIYVEHPNKPELIKVASTRPEYTNDLALPMHKAIQAQLRKKNHRNPNLTELVAARQEIKEMVLSDMRSLSKTKRKESARKAGISNTNVDGSKNLRKAPKKLPQKVLSEGFMSISSSDIPDFDVI